MASSTKEEREAEIAALIARAQDPDDEYDAHHGTDRSEESLAWAAEHDHETFNRVMRKMTEGK